MTPRTPRQREREALDKLAAAAWSLPDIYAAADDEVDKLGSDFDAALAAYKRAILRSERARRAQQE